MNLEFFPDQNTEKNGWRNGLGAKELVDVSQY